MKTSNLLLVAVATAAVAVASSAGAATVLFDFSLAPHQNNIGNTETYTTGALSIFAAGFTALGATTDLWGKHDGGDENGLGLANDPQHEIHRGNGFVQLDLSGLRTHVLSAALTFGTNSTSGGEVWTVYGTNTAGTLAGGTVVATGSNEGDHLLPGLATYRYFDFVETGTGGGQNFLITSISATLGTDPLAGGGVPEPASWALMLLGFGGIGATIRRRRATGLPARS